MKLEIEVKGREEAQMMMKILEEKRDYTSFFELLAADHYAVMAERFDQQRGPYGIPWRALTKETMRKKVRSGHTRMLMETGLLRMSMMGGPSSVEMILPDMMVLGSDLPYAAVQQWGSYKWNVPEGRPFAGWDDEQADNAIQLLADWMIEMMNQKLSGIDNGQA